MGVTGLWRLIEPAGKPVPVETLENKVLAVDISIWLHQMVKGYQDAKGAPLPNAHLIGLFQRLCKLLYFRIKPVFVFDGGYPQLKKETIAKRQSNKLKYNSESQRIRRELALLLSKKTAISGLLGKQISPKKSQNAPSNDDIFKLPALPQQLEESESESDDEQNSSASTVDLHTIDVESDSFKNLPVKEKYDLLVELKETRKMNSWGKLHELPKKSDNFSDFQMQRLLKRRKVQECLQETEKEMGDGGMSMVELESLLNEEGIDTKIESLPSRRIASNNTTRYLLINNVRQALSEAKKRKENEQLGSTSTPGNTDTKELKKDELEDDLEKAIKMSLECSNSADTTINTTTSEGSWTTFVTDSDNPSDSEDGSRDDFEPPDMISAKAYIMQYSDFTERAINQIVAKGNKNKADKVKAKKPNLNEILDDINKEKSVILDKVELSSSDDECMQDATDSKNNTQTPQVVELNITEELDSRIDAHNMDTTHASLVCIDDPGDEVITLNSNIEESPNTSPTVSEQISSPKLESRQESDSSDDDFEDVPDEDEVTKKTVVQLTLNVNDKLDDDIFADIFADKQIPDKNCIQLGEIVETTSFQNDKVEDDDDELQKAIKMSLECVDTEPITEEDETQKIIETVIHKKSLIYRPTKTQVQSPETSNKHESSAESETSKSQESSHSIELDDTPNKGQDIHIENVQKINAPADITTENARKSTTKPKESITVERLNDMVDEIQSEEQNLAQEKGRLDRIGRNITEQMTKEAKELLQIFGIPYIVAPTEAEAQCAFLESVKLTDGTITDDSDIWLFGGQTVYKNFFNQRKHVLQFLRDRIEKSFNLNREQLILLALLVGSDYTTGVEGVGPVTALEILASFPFNKKKLSNETNKQSRYLEMITGLQEFKQWLRSGRRTDNTSLKKKLRNVEVTDDFPSVRVVQAYLEPNVEKSEDKFSWGEPNVTILRDYTKAKFGWSQHKFDEIINPVIKRLLERKSQKSVHDYFKRKVEFNSLEDQMSKRVKAAVQKMGPEMPVTETTDVVEEPPKTRNKGKGKGKKRKTVEAEAGPSEAKQTKTDEDVLKNHGVKVITDDKSGQTKSSVEIKIPKSDRYQEIIPQREKDKQSLLQNKLKAIELFRKTQIDRKKKKIKKKPIQPKAEAELSESSDSN